MGAVDIYERGKTHGLARTAVITVNITIRGWSWTVTHIIHLSRQVLSPVMGKWVRIATAKVAWAYEVPGTMLITLTGSFNLFLWTVLLGRYCYYLCPFYRWGNRSWGDLEADTRTCGEWMMHLGYRSGWCLWDSSQSEPGHSGSGDCILLPKSFISQLLLFLSWTMEGKLVGWQVLYIESKYLIFQNILSSYWGNRWSVPNSHWRFHSFSICDLDLALIFMFYIQDSKKLRCSDSTSPCRGKNSYKCQCLHRVLQIFLLLSLFFFSFLWEDSCTL